MRAGSRTIARVVEVGGGRQDLFDRRDERALPVLPGRRFGTRHWAGFEAAWFAALPRATRRLGADRQALISLSALGVHDTLTPPGVGSTIRRINTAQGGRVSAALLVRLFRCALIATLAAGSIAALSVITADAARADWAPADNLAVDGQKIISAPSIGYDATGRAYAVWTVYRYPADDAVYLRERPPGGPWGAAQLLPTSGTGYVREPAFSVDAAGDLALAWRGNGITVIQRPSGGVWSPQKTFSSPGTAGPASGCPNTPAVDVESGYAVVGWTSYQSCNGNVSKWRVMAARFTTAGGWDATPTVWAQSPVDVNSSPAVTVDPSGNFAVAFSSRNSNNQDQLWTVDGSATSWDTPVLRGTSSLINYPPVIASRDATTLVAWVSQSSVLDVGKVNGSWGGPQYVGPSPQDGPPAAAVGADGTVHVGWDSVSGSTVAVHVSSQPAGGPPADTVVSRPGVTSVKPALAADASGDVVAVWNEIVSGKWTAVAALRPDGQAWPTTPQQVTTRTSDNDTQVQAAIDPYGHALVSAEPLTSGFGTEFDVLLETRDPATAPDTPVSIAPDTAVTGTLLTCDPSGFGGTPPFRYSYRWLRDGTPITSATSATYTAQAADAEYGVSCEVTAANEAGTATSTSDAVVVGATAPDFVSATTLSGTVEAGQTITCNAGNVSGAPTPDITYAWLRNGAPIPDETSPTYDVDVSDAGTSLACQTTAVNDAGSAASASAAATVPNVSGPVLKQAPVVGGPNPAGIGSVLTCSSGTWTGSPTPTYSYAWTRDGVLIDDAYSTTYTVTAADAGTTLRCQVTASNVAGDATTTTPSKRAVDPAPTNTSLPIVRAAPGNQFAVGQDAQCTNGGWKNAQTYAYAWLRDGNTIATGATYRLTSADAGHTLSCVVTASGRGGSATATSAGRALPPAPAVKTSPTISGTPRPTRTLTCKRGTWSDATAFGYGWQRNGTTITGATTNNYTVSTGDVGTMITCTVTASGAGGSTSTSSAPVTITR